MIGIGGWRGRNEKSGPLWYYQGRQTGLRPDAGQRRVARRAQSIPGHHAGPAASGPERSAEGLDARAATSLYATLRGPGQNMKVLATAHSDPANKGTGRDEPILMAISYGKGRVFHTAMGHDVAALRCVGFITTFQRGTEWAATGKVTQKIPPDFPTRPTR